MVALFRCFKDFRRRGNDNKTSIYHIALRWAVISILYCIIIHRIQRDTNIGKRIQSKLIA